MNKPNYNWEWEFDFPFTRTVGNSDLFNLIEKTLSSKTKSESSRFCPPYNIFKEKDSDNYVIEVACAGFSRDDLSAYVEKDMIVISGKNKHKPNEENEYIHRGIARRNFELKFLMEKDYEVSSVVFENGILELFVTRKKDAEPSRKLLTIS